MEMTAIRIRAARPAEAAALRGLAALDDARLPEQPLLVAEVDGESVAAVSIVSGEGIADPFRRTADAAALLRLRAAQLAPPAPRSTGRRGRVKLATRLRTLRLRTT
jgi:hypothetical protein